MFTTFSDAQEHGLDYLGGTSDAQALRDVRRSILEAYRELTNARTWLFLMRHGRIVTNAPFLTGTVMYTQTGGTYERMVVLSGGTWPNWAGPGAEIRVGVVTSQVAEKRSPTILTLSDEVNFGANIDVQPVHFTALTHASPTVITATAHGLKSGAMVVIEGVTSTAMTPVVSVNGTFAATVVDVNTFSIAVDSSGDTTWNSATGTYRPVPTTAFTLYCDTYPLPLDFIAQDTSVYEGNFGGLTYSDPTSALWYERFTQNAGPPRFYTITGNPLFPGRLVTIMTPFPDLSKTVDFWYHRRPRPLNVVAYAAGTVSTTAGSTILTGNGTAWQPSMAGSCLRLGTATTAPTSAISTAPATVETIIMEVISPTSLRLADPMPASTTGTLYIISDPIDFETGVMLTAFYRGLEQQLAIARQIVFENRPSAFQLYQTALKEAQAADSRSFQGRSMGPQRDHRTPYKYMPANFFPGP